MKKIILLALALVGLGCYAQKGSPIQPYRDGGYTIEMVKDFIGQPTLLAVNWRTELLRIVNNGLRQSGEANGLNDGQPLDERHLHWILNNTVYENRSFATFTNSMKVGEEIRFYTDRSFSGPVAVFRFGKCALPIFKTMCMNLIETSLETVVDVQPGTSSSYTQGNNQNGTPSNVTVNVNCNGCNEHQQYYPPYPQDYYTVQSGVNFYPYQYNDYVSYRSYSPQSYTWGGGYHHPSNNYFYSWGGGSRQPRTSTYQPHGTGGGGRNSNYGTGGGGRNSNYGTGGGGRGSGGGGRSTTGGGSGSGGRH